MSQQPTVSEQVKALGNNVVLGSVVAPIAIALVALAVVHAVLKFQVNLWWLDDVDEKGVLAKAAAQAKDKATTKEALETLRREHYTKHPRAEPPPANKPGASLEIVGAAAVRATSAGAAGAAAELELSFPASGAASGAGGCYSTAQLTGSVSLQITVGKKAVPSTFIALGVGCFPYPEFRLPGWEPGSVAFHEHGRVFRGEAGYVGDHFGVCPDKDLVLPNPDVYKLILDPARRRVYISQGTGAFEFFRVLADNVDCSAVTPVIGANGACKVKVTVLSVDLDAVRAAVAEGETHAAAAHLAASPALAGAGASLATTAAAASAELHPHPASVPEVRVPAMPEAGGAPHAHAGVYPPPSVPAASAAALGVALGDAHVQMHATGGSGASSGGGMPAPYGAPVGVYPPPQAQVYPPPQQQQQVYPPPQQPQAMYPPYASGAFEMAPTGGQK